MEQRVNEFCGIIVMKMLEKVEKNDAHILDTKTTI
jgi:hypothetical protein